MKIDIYKKCPMRNILAVLLVMFLFMISSCSNNEPEAPQHDTVYQFDVRTWNQFGAGQVMDTLRISRSADSSQVRNIIFRVAPNTEFEGMSFYGVNNGLKIMFRSAKGKGVAEGTFRNVTDTRMQYIDSVIALGFKVEFKNP